MGSTASGGRGSHDCSQDVRGLRDRLPGVKVDLVVTPVLAPAVAEVIPEAIAEDERARIRRPVALPE